MDEHGRGETAKNGYGVTLYDEKDGKRKSLKVSEYKFYFWLPNYKLQSQHH